MITTAAELDAMEKFFAATTLPGVFKLNVATTIHDLPGYVSKIIDSVKTGAMNDTVAKPRWDDLVEIRRILGKEK